MRISSSLACLGTGLLVGSAAAYSLTNQNRRSFVQKSLSIAGKLGGAFTGWTICSNNFDDGVMPARANAAEANDGYVTTESELKYLVVKPGGGAVPGAGQTVKAHYTGWLDSFDSDRRFDSSRDRGRPFQFRVGAGQVIRGWDEAFAGMRVGEQRRLIIPPRLGYGDRGAGGIIPGGATLYFDVELLGIV